MVQDVYPNFSLTEFTYLFSMEYNAACSSTNFSKRNSNFMQYTFKKKLSDSSHTYQEQKNTLIACMANDM